MKKTLILIALAFVLPGCSLEGAFLSPGYENSPPPSIDGHKLLPKLRVTSENRWGYERDAFEHWSDLNYNGCDTRDEVLARNGSSCHNLRGKWFSPYDKETTRDPSSFDVDHMVPLAEAWDSGANRWSAVKRERYANDMYPYSLIAVSASSNRAKSDQDPAEWLPENRGFVCEYVSRWIAVKHRWKLSVDKAEKQALSDVLSSCPKKKAHKKAKKRG